MTTATIDYLLRLAIAHREALAHQMIRSGEENCPAWGEASAAVKELLEMRQRAAMPAEEMKDD
jgi:hypothetical protein